LDNTITAGRTMIQATTTQDPIIEDIPYPKLMWYPKEELIVLFSTKIDGTVIDPGKTDHIIGHNSGAWADDLFVPYTGSVTLRNA